MKNKVEGAPPGAEKAKERNEPSRRAFMGAMTAGLAAFLSACGVTPEKVKQYGKASGEAVAGFATETVKGIGREIIAQFEKSPEEINNLINILGKLNKLPLNALEKAERQFEGFESPATIANRLAEDSPARLPNRVPESQRAIKVAVLARDDLGTQLLQSPRTAWGINIDRKHIAGNLESRGISGFTPPMMVDIILRPWSGSGRQKEIVITKTFTDPDDAEIGVLDTDVVSVDGGVEVKKRKLRDVPESEGLMRWLGGQRASVELFRRGEALSKTPLLWPWAMRIYGNEDLRKAGANKEGPIIEYNPKPEILAHLFDSELAAEGLTPREISLVRGSSVGKLRAQEIGPEYNYLLDVAYPEALRRQAERGGR